jgi:aspartyl-tRNA(Asn)/glutamyl-tRNA(Gln) amidotransferase subunit B
MRLLNEENISIEDCLLRPKQLADMLLLIDNGTISSKIAKTVFTEMYKTGKDAEMIVREKGLLQISDESAIEKAVDEIIAKHQNEAERFKAGEEKLLGFFVGQVVKRRRKGKQTPRC